MKKVLLIAATLLFQVVGIGFIIARYERVSRCGVELRVPCRLYDPCDPLRGRYMRLNPELVYKDLDVGSFGRTGWYAKLAADTNGLCRVEVMARAPGNDGLWYKVPRVTFDWNRRSEARLSLPDQLFLNEDRAGEVEQEVNKAVRDGRSVVAVYRFLDGRMVLTGVEVDGERM